MYKTTHPEVSIASKSVTQTAGSPAKTTAIAKRVMAPVQAFGKFASQIKR